MIALILNSGTGSRLGSLTDDIPKCLVEVATDRTILGEQLDALKKLEIERYIITTGAHSKKLMRYVQSRYNHLPVRFVYNPEYRTTNYIYSIYLAEEHLQDDIVLLHGDLFAQPSVYNSLLEERAGNRVMVRKESPLPEKDFKARLRGGLVTRIGVDLFDDTCVSLLPLYRIEKEAMDIWLEEISRFVHANIKTVYAEEAFNKRYMDIRLQPLFIDDEICMEIDTESDLSEAKRMLRLRM